MIKTNEELMISYDNITRTVYMHTHAYIGTHDVHIFTGTRKEIRYVTWT